LRCSERPKRRVHVSVVRDTNNDLDLPIELSSQPMRASSARTGGGFPSRFPQRHDNTMSLSYKQ
jgi:hypothetical protein